MTAFRSVALACTMVMLAACKTPTGVTTTGTIKKTIVAGALRVEFTDEPSMPGLLFVRPSADASSGAVTVTNTRYGSLCLYNLGARADVNAGTIEMHVTFVETDLICSADVRKLTYRATLSGLAAGTYDLHLLHDESGTSQEVLSQRVVVK